jgi:hypothetical protein
MKKNRQTNSLTVSNSRWLGYVTAGAAAVVCSAPCADAEIHYSGLINMEIHGIHSVAFPLTYGASLLFGVSARHLSYPRADLLITGAELGSARAASSSQHVLQFVDKLSRGLPVSTGRFGSIAGISGVGVLRSYSGQGNFDNFGVGSIGFKFDVGKGTQYGWVRIRVEDFPRYKITVKDYAWGDVGDSIVTGQERSPTDEKVSAIPHSGSLGLLALGGAGLQAWRAQRVPLAPAE